MEFNFNLNMLFILSYIYREERIYTITLITSLVSFLTLKWLGLKWTRMICLK